MIQKYLSLGQEKSINLHYLKIMTVNTVNQLYFNKIQFKKKSQQFVDIKADWIGLSVS